MTKRITTGYIAICLIVMIAMACSTTVGFKKGAAVAKMGAEQAYSTIYVAHLKGQISDATQQAAAALYDKYFITQSAVVQALYNDNLTVAAQQIAACQAIADQLVTIIIENSLEVKK